MASAFSRIISKQNVGLELLSLSRWFKQHLILWSILLLTHGLSAVLAIDIALRAVSKKEQPLSQTTLGAAALVLLTLAVGQWRGGLPLPSIQRLPLPWTLLLRRQSTWVAWILSAAILHLLPELAFLVPVFLCLTRAPWLRSVQRAFRLHFPVQGSRLLFSQHMLWSVAEALVLCLFLPSWPAALGCLGAALGASSLIFEGDSGVPLLSVWAILGGGFFWGIVCWQSPWALLIAAYWAQRMWSIVAQRVRSGDWVDEDIEY